jgi:hypothetical protein
MNNTGISSRQIVPVCDIRLPSTAEAAEIGRLIYRNECGEQEKFLVHWNVGEEFMSLGIGHFIWYPAGIDKKFTEIFPLLLRFFVSQGITLPDWLTPETPAPWSDIDHFRAALDTDGYRQLLALMKSTFDAQVEFMAQRFSEAIPEILRDQMIADKVGAIAACENGMYLLMDYLNFKGAGVIESERYAEHGWGLLQVLENMREDEPPRAAFADAAEFVLKRRIANSAPERGEERWLPGWLNRINTYR